VRVKICGITRTDDALAAVEAGADAIGLIFAESPRRVTVEQATEIVRVLPPWVAAVGVFVNASAAAIAETVRHVGLTAVQLHGDEPPETVAALSGQVKVVKSFRIGGASDMADAAAYLTRCRPNACLVDSRVEGVYGGTGLLAPWDLVAEARETVRPLILSGGLNPENVAEAIRVVRPFGVDTASGVESEPGRKDAQRVRRFVRAAMEASATLF